MKPITGDGDRDFGQMIARGLAGDAGAGDDCPGADLLAAWTDQLLPSDESSAVTTHVAHCARCQQVTAAIARSEPEVTLANPRPKTARNDSWLWHWRWAVPLATAAIVILIVGSRTMQAPSESPTKMARAADTAGSLSQPVPGLPEKPAVEAPPPLPSERVDAPRAAGTARPSATAGAGATAPKRSVDPAAPGSPGDGRQMARAADAPAAPPAVATRSEDRARGGLAGGVVGGVVTGTVAPIPDSVPAPKPAAADAGAVVSLKEASAPRNAAVPPPPPSASLLMQGTAPVVTAPSRKASVAGSAVTWRFGDGGVVERTADGQAWVRQVSGVTTRLLAGWAVSDRVCWIVGSDGVVLRTEDGASWQRAVAPTPESLVSVFASNALSASVRTAAGREFVTVDGGQTWQAR